MKAQDVGFGGQQKKGNSSEGKSEKVKMSK